MHMTPLPTRSFLGQSILAPAGSIALNAATTSQDDRSLKLPTRRREESPAGSATYRILESVALWNPRETAVIICDMWDLHHCRNATERVGELAPRIDRFVSKAREQVDLVMHAPSSCMASYDIM